LAAGVLIGAAIGNRTPILRGFLQSDLDANQFAVTNLSGLGGSFAIAQTNVTGLTNSLTRLTNYVDVHEWAASSITSGTLGAARLPAFTGGDVTSSAGSAVLTIGNAAVTYAKMQNVSATQRLLGRNTAGAGSAEEVTASQVLDWLGSTRGAVLYRGATGWSLLAPGTDTYVLTTHGAGADPTWDVPSGASGIPTLNGGATNLTIAGGNITTTNLTWNTETLSPSSSTNFVLDLLSPRTAFITATNDVNWLNSTNRTASTATERSKKVRILASGANRLVTLHASWMLVGSTTRTFTVTNGTWLVMALDNAGASETNVFAGATYAQ